MFSRKERRIIAQRDAAAARGAQKELRRYGFHEKADLMDDSINEALDRMNELKGDKR